jgi:hypothetical protein
MAEEALEMKLVWVTVLMASSVAATSPADFEGTWNLRSTWPHGPGLKSVGTVVLEIEVNRDVVTGTAHIGSWPGDAPIAEGHLRGDRISFDSRGHLESSTGIPTCHFEGTLKGDEMVVEMTMTRNPAAKDTFVFKGKEASGIALGRAP